MRVLLIVLMFVVFGPPLVIMLLGGIKGVRALSNERGTGAGS